MTRPNVIVRIGLLVLAVSSYVRAEDNLKSRVLLQGCSELIGFGPVSPAGVASLVPGGYTIASFGPETAGLVVRASFCQQVSVDGLPGTSAIVSQVGVSILSPDGTGNINNYQLFYVTNDDALALALRLAGMPALVDHEMAYEFTTDLTGHSGQLYVAVSPPDRPAYFETGSWSDPPPNSGAPVVANWWFNGPRDVVKMSTSIGSISYGPAALTVYTGRASLLGAIIGGNADNNFAFFDARGLFDQGQLDIVLK